MKDNHQINLECASMLGYKYGPYLDRGKWKVWIEIGDREGREFNPCENKKDFVMLLALMKIYVDVHNIEGEEGKFNWKEMMTSGSDWTGLKRLICIKGKWIASDVADNESDFMRNCCMAAIKLSNKN